MSEIERREQKFEKVNRAFTALYLLMCLAMIVVYAVRRDCYHLGISLGTPLIRKNHSAFEGCFSFEGRVLVLRLRRAIAR